MVVVAVGILAVVAVGILAVVAVGILAVVAVVVIAATVGTFASAVGGLAELVDEVFVDLCGQEHAPSVCSVNVQLAICNGRFENVLIDLIGVGELADSPDFLHDVSLRFRVVETDFERSGGKEARAREL